MDLLFISLIVIISLIGFAGAIVPGLPGAPLNLAAIFITQYKYHSFSNYTLVIACILTVIVLLADFFLPIYFAKKFGATKQGIWGSIIGMIVGMVFTPIGMMLGILAGAIIGDIVGGKNVFDASKSGFANFAGTIAAMLLKIIIATWMVAIVYYELIKHIAKFYF